MRKREKARNAAQIVMGRANEKAGNLTSDVQLERDGQSERAMVKLKQAVQKVKEAIEK